MNMSVVSFEADEQRQHTRYKLPLKCVIDQHRYSSIDWSLGGVGVATGNENFEPGKVLPLQLQIPLDGFDMVLHVKAEVRHSSSEAGRTGLKFVDPSPAAQRMLRYIHDSYISGEIVEGNDILDFAKRASGDVKLRPRKAAEGVSGAGKLRQATGVVATLGLSLALAAFLASSLYQRLWVFEADSAVVTVYTTPVLAPANGIITNVVSGSVKSGERILTVLTESGQSTSVVSSCDCIAESTGAAIDTQVKAGTQVLGLRAADAKPHIVAMVDRSHLMSLYKSPHVSVDLPQGTVLHDVTVAQLPKVSEQSAATSDRVPVKIDLGGHDLSLAVGTPAVVRFDNGPWFGLNQRIAELKNKLLPN
ncbi:PilZ domain-containing protein [Agrobacterium tumefaciens]|uniref:PilZ domain-containing protein n=1 Tax=Agrobacterium tumefaciens TaxID=358 RepID=UPI00287C83BF|nr:PilZ domain-containing protein [Agrobacterium tumefaciens]MDS7597960.1 PilZ domain-containing protein [Agrobacterium tumefaciens]